MKNETYDITMLAVTMCIIAAFVATLMYTIIFGRNMFSGASDKLDEQQERVELATLRELSDDVTEMPVASLLAIVEGAGSNNIDLARSKLTVPTSGLSEANYPDIRVHISGRCKAEVRRLETGLYRVVVHSPSCSISGLDKCNCRASEVTP